MNFRLIQVPKNLIPILRSRHWLFVVFFILFGVGVVYTVSGKRELNITLMDPELIESYELRFESLVSIDSEKLEYYSVKRGGKLDRLFFRVGDEVKQGQILVVVDQIIHRSAVESALSAWKLSQSELSRISKLASSASATQAELDLAQNQFAAKRAELEQARQRLEDGLIRADKDGILKELVFKEGDYISDGSRVLAIESKGSIKIHFDIPHEQLESLNHVKTMDFWCETDQKDRISINDFKILLPDISKQLASEKLEVSVELVNLPSHFLMRNACQVSVLLKKIDRVYKLSFDKVYFEDSKSFVLIMDESKGIQRRAIDIVDTRIEDVFVTMDKSIGEKLVVVMDKNLLRKNVVQSLKKFKLKVKS